MTDWREKIENARSPLAIAFGIVGAVLLAAFLLPQVALAINPFFMAAGAMILFITSKGMKGKNRFLATVAGAGIGAALSFALPMILAGGLGFWLGYGVAKAGVAVRDAGVVIGRGLSRPRKLEA